VGVKFVLIPRNTDIIHQTHY